MRDRHANFRMAASRCQERSSSIACIHTVGRVYFHMFKTSFHSRLPAWHFTSCSPFVHFPNDTAIEPLCYCLLIGRFCGLPMTADPVIYSGKAGEIAMSHQPCCLGELLRTDGNFDFFHPLGINFDFHDVTLLITCWAIRNDPPQSLPDHVPGHPADAVPLQVLSEIVT